jgi:serine protease Do
MKGARMGMGGSRWQRRASGLLAGVLAVGLWQGLAADGQTMSLEDGYAAYLLRAAGAHSGSGSAGRSAQGYLGVDIRDVGEEQAAKLNGGSHDGRGAEILHVDHDGPAGKAGLREHDVVLSMNGQTIEGSEQLRKMLKDMAPGRSVTLNISRDGHEQTVTTQMANREDVERLAWEQHITVPDPQMPPSPPPPAVEERKGFFSGPGRAGRNLLGVITLSPAYTGAMLETMAPQLAEFFGAQGKTGLLVRSVDANSPAALAGMHAGDVVVRVNSTGIATSSDWLRAVKENKGRAISVVVLRERREQTLTMVPYAKHHSSLLPELWPHFGSASGRVKQVPVNASAALADRSPVSWLL